MKNLKHYINGKYIDGNPIATHTTVCPINLEKVCDFGIASESDVNTAVQTAKKILPLWKSKTIQDRASVVIKIAEWLEQEWGQEGEETKLKKLITTEVGKPFPEAEIEVIESADFVRYFCGIAEQYLSPKKIELDQEMWPDKVSYEICEPLGVVGIIKPWNYPLEMFIWSVIPALLAGNTVVLKPSEKSTLVCMELVSAAEYAGIPAGVINIVTGDSRTGQYLVEHPDVAMISFTGSVVAGKDVAIKAAATLKKCCLELGGNDYAIVCNDVDIDLVTNGLLWGAFTNAGQVCVGIKHVLIDSKIVNKVIDKLVEKGSKLLIGRDVGPLVDEAQLLSVEKFVEDAKSKQANILLGGQRSADLDGYYFEPTIMMNVTNEMKLVSEECFGPIMPIQVFDSIEDALHIANSSEYGLGASVWTASENKAKELAESLDVGMVWHNDVNIAFASAPWGGRKSSGVGSELSPAVFHEYTHQKHICVDRSQSVKRDWWYPYV